MPFAPVEGGQIHYEIDGAENLPVLVLSNSLGADLSMWDAQVPAFSGSFRVIRYDSVGHGESKLNADEYKIEMLSRCVIDLLDHLKISKFCFCGLSIGGIIGQYLAVHHASRVVRVVLCNTAARVGTIESWNDRIDAVIKGGIPAISSAVAGRAFTPAFQKRAPETVDRFRKMIEATPTDSYIATCAAIRDCDLRKQVSKIRVKTLVITGKHDKMTTPADGRYLAEEILGSRYVELDVAHLSNLEAPDKFSEEVLKFLTR